MTPAVEAARRHGLWHVVHDLGDGGGPGDWGEEAVRALGAAGVPAERVLKTLVASAADGSWAVAVLPVPRRLDLKALARALGTKSAELASPAEACRLTGSVLGAISPLGQRRPFPTVMDSAAVEAPSVFVSAGRRGLELELRPEELAEHLGAILAPIGR